MLKHILYSAPARFVLGWLAAALIKMTARSIRWSFINPEIGREFQAASGPLIGIFWHNRLIMMTEAWKSPKPFTMLQSPHPDGRLIAKAIQCLGFRTIWGSSTRGRGGAAGLRAMIKTVRGGDPVGITPDGSRGPRMRLNPGIAMAARMTGAVIYPMAWNTRKRKMLNTWDRLLLPCPFSDGVIIWGEPITVPHALTPAEQEEYRQMIEDRLTETTALADRYFGHQPIDPAPLEGNEGRRIKR